MTHAANDFVLHDSFPTSGFGSSEEFLNAVAIAKKNPEKWVEYPVALDHSSIASARKAASEIRPWPSETGLDDLFLMVRSRADRSSKDKSLLSVLYLSAQPVTMKRTRTAKAKTVAPKQRSRVMDEHFETAPV